MTTSMKAMVTPIATRASTMAEAAAGRHRRAVGLACHPVAGRPSAVRAAGLGHVPRRSYRCCWPARPEDCPSLPAAAVASAGRGQPPDHVEVSVRTASRCWSWTVRRSGAARDVTPGGVQGLACRRLNPPSRRSRSPPDAGPASARACRASPRRAPGAAWWPLYRRNEAEDLGDP